MKNIDRIIEQIESGITFTPLSKDFLRSFDTLIDVKTQELKALINSKTRLKTNVDNLYKLLKPLITKSISVIPDTEEQLINISIETKNIIADEKIEEFKKQIESIFTDSIKELEVQGSSIKIQLSI